MELRHVVNKSCSCPRICTIFPSALTWSATVLMTVLMAPPVKPLFTNTTVSLPPPPVPSASASDLTGVPGLPIPYTEGGMKRLRAYAKNPVKMTGRRKHRRGVEKACRNRTIRIVLYTSVHVWRRKSIAALSIRLSATSLLGPSSSMGNHRRFS